MLLDLTGISPLRASGFGHPPETNSGLGRRYPQIAPIDTDFRQAGNLSRRRGGERSRPGSPPNDFAVHDFASFLRAGVKLGVGPTYSHIRGPARSFSLFGTWLEILFVFPQPARQRIAVATTGRVVFVDRVAFFWNC